MTATISMPMSAKVSSNFIIDETSFAAMDGEESPLKTTGGLLEFQICGKFIHFNTIEEF